MHSYPEWTIFYRVCGVIIIIAGIAFLGMLVFLASTVLSLKNTAMRNLKSLYSPPLESTKMLIKTGKGVAQKEMVHIRKIGANVSTMATLVKESAVEVGEAAKSVRVDEIKSAVGKTKNSLALASSIWNLVQALTHRDNDNVTA